MLKTIIVKLVLFLFRKLNMKNDISYEIEDDPGFSKFLSLSNKDLFLLEGEISKQWIKNNCKKIQKIRKIYN